MTRLVRLIIFTIMKVMRIDENGPPEIPGNYWIVNAAGDKDSAMWDGEEWRHDDSAPEYLIGKLYTLQVSEWVDDSAPSFTLFVVGESNPNPAEWSRWSEWALVVARTAEEARTIADRPVEPCCPVSMTKASHLVTIPEPRMGDDL